MWEWGPEYFWPRVSSYQAETLQEINIDGNSIF